MIKYLAESDAWINGEGRILPAIIYSNLRRYLENGPHTITPPVCVSKEASINLYLLAFENDELAKCEESGLTLDKALSDMETSYAEECQALEAIRIIGGKMLIERQAREILDQQKTNSQTVNTNDLKEDI